MASGEFRGLMPGDKNADPSSIGVGKLALPSLRTVRAVFPHTALQLVVYASGMSRVRVGCVQGEQSLAREVGIGPALLVGLASPRTGPFLLLAQDGAQPPSHEAVDIGEHAGRGMLEVSEPTAEQSSGWR